MEKLKFGEIATLDDGKEYICFFEVEENGNNYVFLISNEKPIKVRFAKQTLNNNELNLEMISDQSLKEHLLDLFEEKMK